MLENLELKQLSVPSGTRASAAILLDWIGIVALFALAISVPHPLIYILVFILIGRQQLALAILMHDGAHRRLFRTAAVNDWVCQLSLGAPLLFSMYSYKSLHLKHHQDPLAPDDPDLSLIGGYPIAKSSFARKLARDMFGISYFKFIRYFIYMARKPKAGSARASQSNDKIPKEIVFGSIVVVNLILFSILWSTGHAWLYLGLWVLPAVTVLQVLLRVRGIAEHAGYSQNPDQTQNARTVINPIQTFIFAPHNVNYHIEHHIYPSIPYFNLPRVHELMSKRGSLPAKNVYHGYGQVLTELIR